MVSATPTLTTSTRTPRMAATDAVRMSDPVWDAFNERYAPPPPNNAGKYRHDPVGFVRDCIIFPEGRAPGPYQNDILAHIPTHRRVCARGPHGLGKTTLAAWVVWWFACTRDGEDWKLVTTASVWRQLQQYLWPEIHKWARFVRWDVLGMTPPREGRELLDLALKLRTGSAFAVASDQPTAIEGAHADHILYIFDESKAISDATFDAIEGAFSAGEAYAVAISTPGEPLGRFYDIQRRKKGYEDWWVRAVTLDEAVAAGQVNTDWATARANQWGEESAVYINRVKGEFASSDEDGVIPLSWLEAANRRWNDLHPACMSGDTIKHVCDPPARMDVHGVDVGGEGNDKTVVAPRLGNVTWELRRYSKADPMVVAGHVVGIMDRWGGKAIVDTIGIGAGVGARLKELGYNVEAFVASQGTDKKDTSGELGFINKRAAMWWGLREMLAPDSGDEVAIPPLDLLTGDLVAPKWKVTSGGKIQVEMKADIKKRLGRSTDEGDAVVMSFWSEPRRKGFSAAGMSPVSMTKESHFRQAG